MLQEDNFINLLKEKFEIDAGKSYFPNQAYINRPFASLAKFSSTLKNFKN